MIASRAPRGLWTLLALLIALFGAMSLVAPSVQVRADFDYTTAPVTKGAFRQVVHRSGQLKPVNEQHIIAKLWGQILEIAPQGKSVAKDEVVLRIDATPYEDQKVNHEAYIASLKAQYKKAQKEAEKGINAATEDVASYDLLLTLEKMRLADLKKGPTATDAINAQTNLENAKALLAATSEELAALSELAPTGFVSKEEVRQKQLEVEEQRLKVTESDINYKKLYVLDPVKMAQQELKVRDAEKTRDTARERLELLKRNFVRDNDNRERSLEREQSRLKQLQENIDKTIYKAPSAGTVLHKKSRWYAYQPGRDVNDGWEVMSIPEYARMKVVLTVDEARIANVSVGQVADVMPAGWTQAPFKAKVTRVAEKGRDEFESFADDTTQITGTANRQVFDVEVEIDGNAPVFLPGLSADVEIVLKSMESVTQIPRAAVFKDSEGNPIVRVPAGNGVEIRRIKVLAENEYSAAVEGVQETDRVMVVPESAK